MQEEEGQKQKHGLGDCLLSCHDFPRCRTMFTGVCDAMGLTALDKHKKMPRSDTFSIRSKILPFISFNSHFMLTNFFKKIYQH